MVAPVQPRTLPAAKEYFYMSTEIYYFSGTGNSLHVAKELQRRIPETSLVPIVSLLDKESIETRAETVGFVFPQYAATVPKVVAKVLKKFDPTSAGYLFAIATRGGTVCRAFADVDKLLSKKGRRLDSYFLLTMPSGSEPLVETFSEYITEERIARLESEMLARLDAIQGIITAQEVNREEDLSGLDVPPPDIIKPIMPFIKILGPILLPLGKLAESSFDCIISIIWGAGGVRAAAPPSHPPFSLLIEKIPLAFTSTPSARGVGCAKGCAWPKR
jgi:flavodoxin